MQTVTGFVDKIKGAGGSASVYVYPGEGHAFMNSGEDIIKRMKSESLLAHALAIWLSLAAAS